MRLGLANDSLCVVQEEGAEEQEASVQWHGGEAGAQDCRWGKEHGPQRRGKHDSQADGERPAHVQEFIVRSASRDRREAANHSGGVNSGADQNRPSD